ncbi:hypothetical protein [Flavobacterium sp.]|uniref:hypothetical protein n=1 Tax=Flavobacterium sp. TaxID=239 RepID=UPI003F6996F8
MKIPYKKKQLNINLILGIVWLINGIIKENYPFGKKINLDEIKLIKHFAGDIILKTEKTELTINTLLIDEKSIPELKTELKKLNVEWK